jgi:putative DNA primase/helicase
MIKKCKQEEQSHNHPTTTVSQGTDLELSVSRVVVDEQIKKIQTKVQEIINTEKSQYNISEKEKNNLKSQDVLAGLNNGEDGDADLFIYYNRNKLLYDHSSASWYVWKNSLWILDELNQHLVSFDPVIDIYAQEIRFQTDKLIKSANDRDSNAEQRAKKNIKELSSRIKKLQTLNRKKNILKLAISGENSLGISGKEWDSHNDLLPCENGIVDLKTGDFRENTPEDYIKSIAPTIYKSLEIPAPNFLNAINEIFDKNKALIFFVQKLLGSSISGSITEHIIPIFWGKGRNGKGTILELLKAVLGPLAGPIPSEMLLKQQNSRSSAGASPDILSLKGKRLVWASETEEGRYIDVSKLKWLSGGDTLIARGVYAKNFIEFTPTHTLFVLTNHKPHIPNNEYAMWQRILLIPFELSFVDNPQKQNERKRDPYLKDKLLKEKSGILSWLIKGYLAWQREGLNPPTVVVQQTNQYKEDEDSIQTFIKECCIKENNSRTSFKDLFAAYKNWCSDNELTTETYKKFGSELTKKFEKVNTGVIVYKGISLQK